MEKLIVSPGFVKKIEDEQDTQDQAITSNSQAIAKLNYGAELTSADNLNSISDGTYWYGAGSIPTNTPSMGMNVNATVQQITFVNGSQKYQFVMGAISGVIHTYQRRFFSTWGEWTELVTKANELRTLTSLFEFTGTSGQQITVSGSKNIDEYTLLHFDLYDTNGNIIASLCASPLMLRGIVTHYVYGASTSIWGSFSFTNGTKNLTVNRTSATTSKFRCYGID